MRSLFRCVALIAAFASSSPSVALVGGVVDANLASSPWAGVVSIQIGGGTFSGALIDANHVLTAAHVVHGNLNSPANITVNINFDGNLSSQIVASQVFVHPSYLSGNTPSDNLFAWHDDIAVVRLSKPVPTGVPTYELYRQTPGQNGVPREVTMVAYGGFSDGSSPSLLQGANPGVKRVGQNRVDALQSDDEGTGKAEVFVFDFDGPNASSNVFNNPPAAADLTLGANIEAGYAGGDSGSPVFIMDAGKWKIAGIGAFNGDPAGIPGNALQFGAIGGGMLVAPYADWIEQQTVLAVPEPSAYVMMLVGLGLLGIAVRRHKFQPCRTITDGAAEQEV